ncbi:MAG: sensor histidine kinase [Prolixibacteraceae bacterium]
MKYFKELLGFDEISLSSQEKVELHRKLRWQDQKRIEFFAFISLFTSLLFIILDLTNIYGKNQIYYLVADIPLMCASIIIVTNSILNGSKRDQRGYRQQVITLYPMVAIAWATVIASLKPSSMLNMFTFYIVFLLISFFLSPKIINYISYFIVYLVSYISINLLLGFSIFSQTLILFLIGSSITIPFYTSFRATRINAISALLRLDKSNQYLEHEVLDKISELKIVNEDLNNEITQRKIVEIKLRAALHKAEMSDQLKTEFLANISHEIRTPLNAIIGFTELLTEDGVSAQQKIEFQKLVGSNTMFLLSTIDDIFDASMANTQQIKAINAPLKVNKFLDGLFYEITGITLKYSNSKLQLIPVKLNDQETIIFTDEYYLKKAMLRLIDNAYKFSSEGSIEVGAILSGEKLELYVKDSGIGIRDADKEKIFLPFVQGDGSYTRDYGGSGLGLCIVQGIVNELKCDFNLDTQKDVGSRFSLSFNRWHKKLN